MNTPILETERLILRPLSLNDAEHIFKTWTIGPDVAKFMIWGIHKNIDDTVNSVKEEFAKVDSANAYL